MFDELFNVFVYKKNNLGKIEKVVYQGDIRVLGDHGIENFEHMIFNYACDGFVVEIEKYS